MMDENGVLGELMNLRATYAYLFDNYANKYLDNDWSNGKADAMETAIEELDKTIAVIRDKYGVTTVAYTVVTE